MFTDGARTRTIVAAPAEWEGVAAETLRKRGVTVLALPGDEVGYFSALAEHLGKMGLLAVLCEGGGHLAGALARCGLVDELHLFLAPMLLGDSAVPAFANLAFPLDSAPRFRLGEATRVGGDVHLLLLPDAPAP